MGRRTSAQKNGGFCDTYFFLPPLRREQFFIEEVCRSIRYGQLLLISRVFDGFSLYQNPPRGDPEFCCEDYYYLFLFIFFLV